MAAADKPGPAHMARYRGAGQPAPDDARIFAPTFLRNSPPMIARLTPWLADRRGPVLEIGAGTGQHAAAFALAFEGLDWWPSDPDDMHRASVSAWQTALRAPQNAPFDLDGAGDWAADGAVQGLGPLTAVLSMNVIHIAPIAVAQGIVAGAAAALAPQGLLIFYGPFKENKEHTGPGNAAFDAGLRAENADWGLRDISELADLATPAGLTQVALINMPANNRLLIFRKS